MTNNKAWTGQGLRAQWALSVVLATATLAAWGSAAPGDARGPHRASVTANLDCSACHTPSGWKSVGAASGSTGFDHSRTGFPLTGRHGGVPCVGCHKGETRVSRDCASCHEDAHGGRLGAACDSCHSAAGWQQTEALARHRRTRLPLTGMHAVTECRDCHARGTEVQWTGIAADCFACHADDYRRQDIHPPHTGDPADPNSQPFPRDCTGCHRTTAWIPAFVPADLVARGFSLTSVPPQHDAAFPISFGSHRGAACASCHTSADAPAVVSCTGCHAHSEVKLREQHHKLGGVGSDCVSCHRGGGRR